MTPLHYLSTVLLTILVLGTAPASLFAASFDCNKAATHVEKLICSDPELSGLDEELSSTYRQALASTNDSQKEQVKQYQREWLKLRNQKAESGVLKELYLARIESLHNLIENNSGGEQGQPDQVITPSQPAQESQSQQAQSAAQPDHTTQPQQKQANESSSQQGSSEPMLSGWTKFWIFLIASVAFIIIGIYMHQNGNMTVYYDYTDAAMTLASIAVPIIVAVFTANGSLVPWIILAIMLFFPAKASFVYNPNLGMAILSLVCKLASSLLYVIAIFGSFAAFSTGAKRDDETTSDYNRRKAGDNIRLAIATAIATFLYTHVVQKSVRTSDFTPDIFNLSFQNKFQTVLAIENEEAA